MDPLPIIEPFRIQSVRPVRRTTDEERAQRLEEAGYNLFRVPADDVLIDLLTDSGTGAMSTDQWAAIMRGDESYARAKSFDRFEQSVQDVTGFPHVVPTHQGRAAEHLLFGALVRMGDVVPNNTHFDTTRANLEVLGARAVDLPCKAARSTSSDAPFKGDIDLERLAELLAHPPGRVPFVLVTITNNAGGGQPVSLANLRATRELCDRYGVPLFLDACRFAENAWMVKQREPGQGQRTAREIAGDFFALAEGCTMSAKKDGLANIGGFLALRDGELTKRVRERLVVVEGFPTYGGLAGRDLEAVAQGLQEVLDEDYLAYRHASIRYVVERLAARGIPVLRPAGGHAIFLDAAEFLPHVAWEKFPGQALACELYLEGGVRTCELGSLMLGGRDDAGRPTPAAHELVRLAVPRRTYTQSHMDYVVEIVTRVFARRDAVEGIEIVEAPAILRHFSATMRRATDVEVLR